MRAQWWWLAGIVAAGLLSRMFSSGYLLLDKYLGDALYAAMVYVLLRLSGTVSRVALWTCGIMVALEVFQLTGIPKMLFQSGAPALRILARLLGTDFSFLDLLAYAVGIAIIAALDKSRGSTSHQKFRV